MEKSSDKTVRNLVIVSYDQLNPDSGVFDGFDAARDAVFMAETAADFTDVWSHKVRIAFFIAAMRHFRDELRRQGISVIYRELESGIPSLEEALATIAAEIGPQAVISTRGGSYDRQQELEAAARQAGSELEIRPDNHFLCPRDWFENYRRNRKSLRQEYFYREMRRMHNVLMDDGHPAGGDWNYDKRNREHFGKAGPADVPVPTRFSPDRVTRAVLSAVEKTFPNHPGRLDRFDWPVTREQALVALDDFIANRLPDFGTYQDAMWTGEPYLYHSRLSGALNLKLLGPMEVVRAAEEALARRQAPLNAVEGFVRQILGWREYVRAIYWSFMPEYRERNALGADQELPAFYWTGETDMACLHACIGQTLEVGYAHHIQRLMVTGLFAMLLGVKPRRVHEWYLAVYLDAHEWVELPNTLGMSQFGDGGLMASKPYAATGKYIGRMSNYCDVCRYNPSCRTGANACPFTVLYWDFLMRNEPMLQSSPRMRLQLRNLDKVDDSSKREIRSAADRLREGL